ncbi:MAG: hypothetical protein HYV07_19770 [Deltaproteobacteria bacterium]|nr:hypothetical protein [Deltaproteobacteria bacterium]
MRSQRHVQRASPPATNPPTTPLADLRTSPPAAGPSASNPETGEHPARLLLRLAWLLVGHVALVIMLVMIATGPGGPSWRDGVLGTIVILTLGARYVDIQRFRGTTADGEPADLSHFRGHAVKLVVLATVGAAFAHAWALYG